MSASPTTRVAIVGGGPRAVWALETLARHAGRGSLDVDVLAGAASLLGGVAYAADEPDVLRLNVPASAVDAWSTGPRHGPSLDAWREHQQPGSSHDPYPPRSVVGRYLRDQADTVLGLLAGARCPVRVLDETAADLEHDASGWWVATGSGLRRGPYDEVLVAVGHATTWPGALEHHRVDVAVPLHASVFPTTALTTRPELRSPRGERPVVVVRGAALTAYDAVLALTAAVPDVHVVLTSRSGRLMHPKTDAAVLAERVDVPALAARAEELLGDEGLGDVRPALATLAAEVLGRDAGAAPPDPADQPADDPVTELRRAVAVACGEAEPGPAWAWAQAWRGAYATMVRRQARTAPTAPTLHTPGWPRLAGTMERLAFGPPPATAARVLDLLEEGTMTVVTSSGEAADVAGVAQRHGADLVVDAVLAPPGVRDLDPASLLGRLVAHGHLVAAPSARGCLVDQACHALRADGSRVPGLSVVGRATEDVVLGTDTLVRALHPQLDGWAREVCGAAA